MTHKKRRKFRMLSKCPTDFVFELRAASAMLINCFASVSLKKNLSPRNEAFALEVIAAFDRIYGKRPKEFEPYFKQKALTELEAAESSNEREKAIDSLIEHVNEIGLNARDIQDHHRRNLIASRGNFGPGKRSDREHALSVMENLFPYSKSEYYRDRRRMLKLEKAMSHSTVNPLNFFEVAYLVLNQLLELEETEVKTVLGSLWTKQAENRRSLVNDGIKMAIQIGTLAKRARSRQSKPATS